VTDLESRRLIAYYRGEKPRMRIVPASRWREWMNQTVKRNANRCLPLLAANEYGWVLLNEHRTVAEWSGEEAAGELKVDYQGLSPHSRAGSVFGHGIVTFRIPYLFRTPEGWDLLVRGPTNWPKDGVTPLDGVVEADWAVSTFTMNWKLTRPGTVVFERDEPICMIVPQRRRDLESFAPEILPVQDDASVDAGWTAFVEGRREISFQKFVAQYTDVFEESRDAWEGDYFRGRRPDGPEAPEHVTKRRLRAFGGDAAA
jgi:hypothetical protein